MANALTLRFGSDTAGAQRGVTSLAQSIASSMTQVSGTALLAGRNVMSFGTTTVNVFQNIQRSAGLIGPAFTAIALGATAAFAAFSAASAVTNLAKERLEEYVDIADRAARGGVSAEFFQRQAKAAEAFKIEIDDVSKALERLRSDTAGRLGGSGFQNRLNELTGAGNFAGNSGVAQFASANTAEQRFRAIVALIDEAMQKGERLAALDLAARFLPASMMEQLRANSGYLTEMQQSADRLAATKIVSDEDVARAVSLKSRLEEAEKTLSERFKPIQDDLVRLGTNYHENWIAIIERLANAVRWANDLYQALKGVQDVVQGIGNSDFWKRFHDADAAKAAGITLTGAEPASSESPEMAAAKARLRSGLLNPATVRRASEETTNVAFGVRRDTSAAPAVATGGGQSATERLDQVEQLINRMERLNKELEVEQKYLGQNNVEREKGIAIARAEAAARAAGRDLTTEEIAKVNELATANFRLKNTIADVAQAQRQAADTARFFGNVASDALADVIIDGKNAADVMRDLSRMLLRSSLSALITGQGPLAGMFGTAPAASAGPNAVGGIAGWFTGLFRAGGGDVRAGQAVTVGELGREVFVPGQDGKVYPIGQMQGGGMSLSYAPTIDARGSTVSEAQIRLLLAESQRQMMMWTRRQLGPQQAKLASHGI